jgi:phosphatidylglycerophosphatase A
MEIRFNKEKIRDTAWGLAASGFYSGFSPVWPGAAGSILGAVLWWLVRPRSISLQFLFVVVIFILGWFAAKKAEDWWGQDDRRIVADEMAGIWLTLWTFDRNPWVFLLGIIFFLIINLIKFYPALICHRFGWGWGVMMEKAAVGAYAGILLSVAALFLTPFPVYQVLFSRLAVYGAVLAAAGAAHLYGSVRGGLRVAAVAAACYAFLRLAPIDPWRQLLVLTAAAGTLLAAAHFLRKRLDSLRQPFEYLFLFWGCWAALWFLPKSVPLMMAGALLMSFFRYLRPYPSNYLPSWGAGSTILTINLVAAVYTGSVLQVASMMFLPERMVFIKYAVINLMRLLHI